MPGKTPEEIKANAAETSKEVELSRFADRYSHELPNRQKQLRRFSGKLINQRHSLLLDEPIGRSGRKVAREYAKEVYQSTGGSWCCSI